MEASVFLNPTGPSKTEIVGDINARVYGHSGSNDRVKIVGPATVNLDGNCEILLLPLNFSSYTFHMTAAVLTITAGTATVAVVQSPEQDVKIVFLNGSAIYERKQGAGTAMLNNVVIPTNIPGVMSVVLNTNETYTNFIF